MKLIDISTPKYPNTFTMVDDEDFERLNKHKWTAIQMGKRVCVVRGLWGNGKTKLILMHREVIDISLGEFTDHIDRNPLNNQRDNLRKCTKAQNSYNIEKRNGKKYSSKYLGVSFHKSCKKWRSYVTTEGQVKRLGHFKTEEEAAAMRDLATLMYCGEFGVLNFPL